MALVFGPEDEIVLQHGNKTLVNAVAVVSDPIDLQVSERVTFYIASNQAGTYDIEGQFAGQWVSINSGNYAANTLYMLYMRQNVPPIVRITFTPTVSGRVLLTVRRFTGQYQTFSDLTPAALAWIAGIAAIEFVPVGPSADLNDVNLMEIKGTSVDTGAGTGGSATLRVITDTASIIDDLKKFAGQGINLGAGTGGTGTLRVIPDSASIIDDLKKLAGQAIDLGVGTGGSGTQRVILDTATIVDDLKKFNGQTIDLGTGTGGTGTQRVILDTAAVLDDLKKLNGVAISMDTGVRDAGTQRVTVATDDIVQTTPTQSKVPIVCNEPSVTDAGAGAFINNDVWNNVTLPGGTLIAGARYEVFVLTAAPVMDQGILYLQHSDKATLDVLPDIWGKVITANSLYEICPDAGIPDLSKFAIKREASTPLQYKVLLNRVDT